VRRDIEVPLLRIAASEQIDRIYAESYALWGAGLKFPDYREFWNDLARTPWARRALSFHVWCDDDGAVLSSLKLYQPRVRLAGKVGNVAGIGAVFTPKRARRRGHASEMIRAVIEQAGARGDLAALLFSDVGTKIYASLGFRDIPAEEAWGRLDRKAPGPPAGWVLRPMAPADLELARQVRDDECGGRPFAVLRDREHWEYLYERSRNFFARLDGSDLSRRFTLAMQDGNRAGYLVAVESGDVWVVREAGAVGGDPERLAAVLRAGANDARSRGMRRVYGWIPREVSTLVPEWRLTFKKRERAIPMLLRLDGSDDLSLLDAPEAAFIPYLDQF
jgi:GNAT superfamily N-acetyltransferase